MRVEIRELAGGGAGFARVAGRSWFVAGALPGEVVEAEEVRSRAGVVEARVVRLILASPDREPSPCPVLDRCGGCGLGHVRREAAAEALRQVTLGGLRHAPAEISDMVRRAPVAVSPAQWRLRARLAWNRSTGILGFRGARSHQVTGIRPCRVISPLLGNALESLTLALQEHSAGDGEVTWLENLEGSRAVAAWRGPGLPRLSAVPGLIGWCRLDLERSVSEGGWGDRFVIMGLPVPLRVPVSAFFQGNRYLLPALWCRVGQLVAGTGLEAAVDLYGGVGTFAAAALHAGVRHLTVVESNPAAAEAARGNLPGAAVLASRAEEYLQEMGSSEVVAILDPPREGMSADGRARLLEWRPRAIVLLSCDPATFGRDAGGLRAAGYELRSIELWDMFAGSHHVEILAEFRLAMS